MLPGLDGLQICRAIRADADTAAIPIIMLTAKAEESDRIVGLELGADDYITKPFSPNEVVARVRALLRRAHRAARAADSRLTYGALSVDVDRHVVKIDGDEVKLTAKEFLLLQYLMQHRGRVLSRDLLLSDVWGYSYTGGTRTVDVHVRRLREKLPMLGRGHRHRQAVRLQAARPGAGLMPLTPSPCCCSALPPAPRWRSLRGLRRRSRARPRATPGACGRDARRWRAATRWATSAARRPTTATTTSAAWRGPWSRRAGTGPARRRLARDRARMEAILASMVEGVLVVDEQGRLQLVNEAARRMLKLEQRPIGRSYVEAIRHPGIVEQIARALAGGATEGLELSLARDTRPHAGRARRAGRRPRAAARCSCCTTSPTCARPIRSAATSSPTSRTSCARRSPPSRATPKRCWTIRTTTEARQRFLEIIHRQAARMERLVKDLLRLARLDAGQETVELRPVRRPGPGHRGGRPDLER